MPDTGAVYLVGAGPGDPGLMTVKGLRVLRAADVVVYDRLINPSILAEAPPAAETVYVGKGLTAEDGLRQGKINELLIEHARRGQTVVRLKGGDPFLFGRGGEEAGALAEAGVPFEIIPGVSSALAVPAYAGIPATDRRVSSAVRIITGQRGEDAPPPNPAERRETVIALMGVQAIPDIVQSLRADGWADDTPIALIENGTTARQRTVEATLATAVDAAARARVVAPAILVAGNVVGMRAAMSWYERKPLFGKRVMVLRGETRAHDLIAALEGAGAEVIHVPAVAFAPPPDWQPVDDALRDLDGFRWIAFSSINGVDFFLRRLMESGRDARALAGVRIAAIGPSTAGALRRHGLIHELMPERFDSQCLADAMGAAAQTGDAVLLPRGDLADGALPDALREHRLVPRPVVTYRTIPGPDLAARSREAIERGIDAVVLTSPSTAHNLILALGGSVAPLGDVAVISAGPTTTSAAELAGMSVTAEAGVHTTAGVLEAMTAWAGRTRHDDRR